MSLIRTESKPYKSLCSDLYVDAPNFIAEMVCRRKQEKENSGSLPIKFWNHPKYKNLYIREVSQARNLLKKYPPLAIIKALEDYRSRYILSLRNKNLIPIIEEILPTITASVFEVEEVKEVVKAKPVPGKKNILGKL